MTPQIIPAPKINFSTIPIFFVERGGSPGLFLKKILKQAELSNGRENVYLLTDANFELYREFNCIDISPYLGALNRFDKLYKHHSINPFAFEKVCFDRWFIINELIKNQGIEFFFHADCDVLIASDISPVYEHLIKQGYEGSTMFFEHNGDSVTSGHSSFWSSELIDEFCNFICAKYADPKAFDIILQQTLAGKFLDNRNVSDMIFLDVFRTEKRPKLLNLLILEDGGSTFDFNLNVSYNGYRHHFVTRPFYKIKKIKRLYGKLYAQVQNSDKTLIAFYTFHFQGYLTKSLIPLYVTSANVYQFGLNYATGTITFLARRARLLKNHIKTILKTYLGK
ncbi:MAG: hypothetical protein ACXVAY_21470 [Mucilaginibacter sp.]